MTASRPNRVALLEVLPSEQLRSIDRFTAELHDELQRLGVHASRFAPHAASRSAGRIRRQYDRYITYPRAVDRVSADVFHIVDQSYGHLLHRLPGDRCIVTCHDLTPLKVAADSLPVHQRQTVLARYRYSARALKHARHVACVSASTERDVHRFLGLGASQVVVIPPGLDPRFHRLPDERVARVREELVDEDSPLLLHVDSGLPYKNVLTTLRVIHRLRAEGVPARLARVGVPLSPEAKELARRLAVNDCVEEYGRVDDRRLVDLYNAADVLLFPSYYEGFGWPVLEAMACGTPVVVSNCPALVELISSAGIAADAEDVSALSRGVARIVTTPRIRSELRASGLARAAEFSWGRTARGYASLYGTI